MGDVGWIFRGMELGNPSQIPMTKTPSGH